MMKVTTKVKMCEGCNNCNESYNVSIMWNEIYKESCNQNEIYIVKQKDKSVMGVAIN